MDGWFIHHFHPAGNNAFRDNVGNALSGILAGWKANQQSTRCFRLLQNTYRHFCDDTEQAFRSGYDTKKIIAIAFKMLTTEPDYLAVNQHHLHADNVV